MYACLYGSCAVTWCWLSRTIQNSELTISHEQGGTPSHDQGGITAHDQGGTTAQDQGGITGHEWGVWWTGSMSDDHERGIFVEQSKIKCGLEFGGISVVYFENVVSCLLSDECDVTVRCDSPATPQINRGCCPIYRCYLLIPKNFKLTKL